MTVYLRSGEMNILADHHLPLMDNPYVEGMGDWDLRVFVGDGLVGIHNFSLAPSYEDRRARLNRGKNTGGGQYYVTSSEQKPSQKASPKKESGPMSLEDLLRNQGGGSGRS
jgi:hypothetical protein